MGIQRWLARQTKASRMSIFLGLAMMALGVVILASGGAFDRFFGSFIIFAGASNVAIGVAALL